MADRTSTGFILPADAEDAPRVRIDSEPSSKRRRPVRGERIAVYLPPELVENLRVRCVFERRSVSDAVTEAVASWMK